MPCECKGAKTHRMPIHRHTAAAASGSSVSAKYASFAALILIRT